MDAEILAAVAAEQPAMVSLLEELVAAPRRSATRRHEDRLADSEV